MVMHGYSILQKVPSTVVLEKKKEKKKKNSICNTNLIRNLVSYTKYIIILLGTIWLVRPSIGNDDHDISIVLQIGVSGCG